MSYESPDTSCDLLCEERSDCLSGVYDSMYRSVEECSDQAESMAESGFNGYDNSGTPGNAELLVDVVGETENVAVPGIRCQEASASSVEFFL